MRCYFLIYRITGNCSALSWDKPTGGLVVEAEEVINGTPICDMEIVTGVAYQRYHCDPWEELWIEEAYKQADREIAATLHDICEYEISDFRDLMEAT